MLPLLPVVMGLAQFAPTLLRFFGAGAASTAVAEQVSALAQTVSGAATPQEALAAISRHPELQAQFRERVLELDAVLEQAYLADVQDARRRDIEIAKLGRPNHRADLMVALDVIGLVACLVVLTLFRKDIPGEVIGLLSSIASIFGLCLRDAHQFEFGSSRGSRNKDLVAAERGKSETAA